MNGAECWVPDLNFSIQLFNCWSDIGIHQFVNQSVNVHWAPYPIKTVCRVTSLYGSISLQSYPTKKE